MMNFYKSHTYSKASTIASNSKFPFGFTLVEIMVAMVIGLLGVLVIMQVFTLFEGQKRTTTGGVDAQNNGAIALNGIERDIRQSGWNFNTPNIIGCNATFPSGITLPLAPVTINPPTATVPSGDADTDTLLVMYGNSNGASEGDVISAQLVTNQYGVTTPTAFNTNDMVLAQPQVKPGTQRTTTCDLIVEAATVPLPKVNVYVGTGVASVINGRLFDLGSSPRILAYAIRNGNLTVCDYLANNCGDASKTTDASVWVPIGDNIVSMRAQYGRDTSTVVQIDGSKVDGIVDVYDQTTPSTDTSTNACEWLRISSVQMVLVSRSTQPEKAPFSTDPNTIVWKGQAADSTISPQITSAPIVLTGTSAIVPTGFTWQSYRYKIFQTIIPLRNITSVLASAKGVKC